MATRLFFECPNCEHQAEHDGSHYSRTFGPICPNAHADGADYEMVLVAVEDENGYRTVAELDAPKPATKATRTTRTRDFEDVSLDRAWPKDVQGLHHAALSVWVAFSYLDDAYGVAHKQSEPLDHDTRGEAAQLAGQAYALLRAIRAAGDKRLAAWEASQAQPDTDPADTDDAWGAMGFDTVRFDAPAREG